MKKLNIIVWIFLVKILIGSILLLGWDMYQTKQELLATQQSLDNAVRLNEILERQVEECGKR